MSSGALRSLTRIYGPSSGRTSGAYTVSSPRRGGLHGQPLFVEKNQRKRAREAEDEKDERSASARAANAAKPYGQATASFPASDARDAGIALAPAAGWAVGHVAAYPYLTRPPAEVHAQLVSLLPASLADRDGWASDVQAAFRHIDIPPSTENLCAALAVTAQESTYTVDPVVPGLGRIAREEIDRRAARYRIPAVLVRAALKLASR